MNNPNDIEFTELRDITCWKPIYKFRMDLVSGEAIYFDATKDDLKNLISKMQAVVERDEE